MRKIAMIQGGSMLALAASAALGKNQPQVTAMQGRHRGREMRLKAPVLGKTEQA